ncbi:MAG: NAD(P)/FAD-dependent oxidoreductase [Alcanivoracaceae bacterium]|jgi:cation diffusion facilitator CzcD-associated flavoprotein CzcO|nr:NAD(P)/FAD-dependent oxidoreductase [Alcanivoracaceae bacterium]
MTSQAKIKKPTTEIVDTVIVGAGFGGLCMAIKLQEAGNTNFVILEKADEVGGTWRDNSYPGCACDVQSHMYSFSFEGKADWSKRYAPWNEIQDYILKTTDKYGIRHYMRYGQEVTGAVFDETSGRWTIKTAAGNTYNCRHWVLASGPLHVPQIPKIKGLENFKGKVFHSARWDHDYDLKGKKVVSIGTGGSAIQYCPEIAPDVEKLHVFQRTPAWVIPRDERKYPELEKKLYKRFPLLRKLHRARCYWTNESRVWPIFNPAIARTLQNLAKAFIRIQVKDKTLARKLTPDYTLGCKRILISNKWYPMFNRDNVELVTDGIQEVREHSIVTSDGVEREADCIILGTGFVVDPRIYMADFELKGLGGRRIQDDWADAAQAYYGINVSGYPNMHLLVGPNTGLGHNSIIFMIESQVHYILDAMKKLDDKGADYLDVKQEKQDRFVDRMQDMLEGTVWTSGCTSWYQQADGKNTTIWPASTWRYWLETRKLPENAYTFVSCAKSKHSKADTAETVTA